MNDSYIWSESTILDLIDRSSEAETVQWAVSRFYSLYPESAHRATARFLDDGRESVVRGALEHMGDGVRHDLLTHLRTLYMEGAPDISALAIHTAGRWRVPEAIEWMQERIVGKSHLTSEQVAAMLLALGSIPDVRAYELLKMTEEAIREKDSPRWEIFYTALLMHENPEDVETLIGIFLRHDESEEKRRTAFGLLLGRVDPWFNPSDLFFENYTGARKHLAERLDKLREEFSSERASAALRDVLGGDSRLETLEDLIGRLHSESVSEAAELLESLTGRDEGAQGFEIEVTRRVLRRLKENPPAVNESFALICLALSAFLENAIDRCVPPPSESATWEEKAADLLKDRYPKPRDRELIDSVVAEADHSVLTPMLMKAIEENPAGWEAVRAVEMLGKLKALGSLDFMVKTLAWNLGGVLSDTLEQAFLQMGSGAARPLLALLDSSDPARQAFALKILSERPTPEVVEAVRTRFADLHATSPESALDAARKLAAGELLDVVEKEYYPGEWAVGGAYVHICRVHGLNPPRLREIERDVERGKEFFEQHSRIFDKDFGRWPSAVQFELACRKCGKKFHYEIHEMHLHPQPKLQPQETAAGDSAAGDQMPYRHGVVICDDLRCKACGSLNELDLTPSALGQLTAESLKLLAMQRSNLPVPQNYPLKHVQVGEKDGKPLTLTDVEQEHLDAVRHFPAKPQGHVALGKFYEYVKLFPKAREAYLKALDVDSKAIEAMAGLARIYHAEEKLREAYEWIDNCYSDLSKGHMYLTDDPKSFKRAVREKRREFAQQLGIRPQEAPVEVLYRVDAPDYPKNRPCPCGSGKKFKLCCMKE